MSLSKDITIFFDRSSKKRDLSDQSKERNSGDEPKKIREEKSSIESLSEMSDDVFAESLKSPACVEILFNCLRNKEKQMKGIFVLAKSTQEQQIKGERQLHGLHDSVLLTSDKFKEYEEDRAKKNEVIGNLQSEVRILSSKVSKLEKQADQQEQYSSRNCLLVHGIKEVRGEVTDDVIIETISQNLDIDIAPHDIERSHRIGQSRQSGEKPRPIVVNFVRYNDRNKIFRNKKNLKGKKISITESLTASRMEKLKEARELHGFRNI